MKIAILTMHRIINYGSVLQAYSLKHLIENKWGGVQVDFLDIENENCIPVCMPVQDKMDSAQKMYNPNRTLLKRIRWKINRKLYEGPYRKTVANFMDKVLSVSSENCHKKYDAVIVGSDEVFKCMDTLNLQMFGDIKQSEYIITYAASCGSAEFSGIGAEYLPAVKDAMSNYKFMSVRDEHTKEFVGELYNGIIEQHLDPVLVGDLYARKHKRVPFDRYMIVYAYGSRIRNKQEIEAIQAFAKKRGLKTIAIGGAQNWCDYFVPISPMRVLDYFYYAEYVVTDTFHGTIFSVINHCKFATILRVTNQNKLGDLLNKLGLQSRKITDIDMFESIIDTAIDYKRVDEILVGERIRTYKYLKKALPFLESRDC